MYADAVMDHFINPRNVGIIEDADGVGEVGDPECGDYVRVYIRVADEHIADITFQCQGCPAAIACASLTTEMARGRHVDDAWEITDELVLARLGELPSGKLHCSVLAPSALHEAIIRYVVRSTDPDSGQR